MLHYRREIRVLLGVAVCLAPTLALAQGEGTSPAGGNGIPPMISRAEAEKFLPPPVKVVDLSKPGNVYKSSDPLVAAAVADYLAKIKEPHDQFGNIITKNYKSAQLPDTVDSKLIGHIVTFVKDQRFIALSPRAAQSLAATQHIQRQTDIDRIIYEDWAAKVRKAAAEGKIKPSPTGSPPPTPTSTATPTPTATATPTPTPTATATPTPSATPAPSPTPPATPTPTPTMPAPTPTPTPTPTSTPPPLPTPTATTPPPGGGGTTPGATTFQQVLPIIQTNCAVCHPSFVNQSSFDPLKPQAASRVSSKNMPKSGSPQAGSMTDAERTALVKYCNGQ